VDDGDEPVPVLSDVKDHVATDRIGILEHAAYFRKIVPSGRLDDAHPSFDFVRRIRVAFHRLAQMLTRVGTIQFPFRIRRVYNPK